MTIIDKAAPSLESASLDVVSTTSPPRRGNFYGRLWRLVPRELGFLLLGLPLGVIGLAPTIGLFATGVGTIVTLFIGVLLLIVALYLARGFGTLELVRLRWSGRPEITRPDWRRRTRKGFWGWLGSVLGNGHYWLYLLHAVVVNFIVSVITWVISFVWTVLALSGLSYWFWDRFIPNGHGPGAHDWYVSQWVLLFFGRSTAGVDLARMDDFVYLAMGVILLATLPFVTRGLVMVHQGIARGMLGAFRAEALERRVGELSESRGAAIAAEGHSLRRLERDIHDGPQQRLVRLQMDIAAAERQLDADPERARTILGEAMEQSREALEELRALSRGFAPPILLDRGLVAALESLGVRSPIPVRVESELVSGAELPQEIERNAYFVASELLTNVVKHASATGADVRLRRVERSGASWLDVVVADNGTGGAVSQDDHGLAGLDERLRGLGGTLEIVSPVGGPTVVTGHLPMTY